MTNGIPLFLVLAGALVASIGVLKTIYSEDEEDSIQYGLFVIAIALIAAGYIITT